MPDANHRPSKQRRMERPSGRSSSPSNPWDLQSLSPDQEKMLELLGKLLRERQKIVVIMGAGVSVSAGSKS